MPLAEKYAKWHRLKGISSIMPKKTTGMMLIINVSVTLRYALWLPDVFLATYQ
jgi:hypothetical protein